MFALLCGQTRSPAGLPSAAFFGVPNSHFLVAEIAITRTIVFSQGSSATFDSAGLAHQTMITPVLALVFRNQSGM